MTEWKCVCGQWVSTNFLAHSHAESRTEYDPTVRKYVNAFGTPPEIWTRERKPSDEVRALVSS